MEKKTDIFENFKIAIKSTIKSISGNQEVEVVFGNKSNKDKKNIINLPEVINPDNELDYLKTKHEESYKKIIKDLGLRK